MCSPVMTLVGDSYPTIYFGRLLLLHPILMQPRKRTTICFGPVLNSENGIGLWTLQRRYMCIGKAGRRRDSAWSHEFGCVLHTRLSLGELTRPHDGAGFEPLIGRHVRSARLAQLAERKTLIKGPIGTPFNVGTSINVNIWAVLCPMTVCLMSDDHITHHAREAQGRSPSARVCLGPPPSLQPKGSYSRLP